MLVENAVDTLGALVHAVHPAAAGPQKSAVPFQAVVLDFQSGIQAGHILANLASKLLNPPRIARR